MRAEHVGAQVEHDGDREHRDHQVAEAVEPAESQTEGADDADRPGQVEPDEDDLDRGPGVVHVGAEELEHGLEGHPGLMLQRGHGRVRLDRRLPVSAQGGDDPRRGRAEPAGHGGRPG